MFNFERPKNPYRKKGKDYNLSDNSKLTSIDFSYSRKLASRIYSILKILENEPRQTDTFSRFANQVYQAVRNDQLHELGQLKLGYGSVESLRNFRFSKKNSWQSFFRNYPTADFQSDKGEVCLTMPPTYAREFHLFPERASKVIVRMHCIQISIDNENRLEHCSSKELIITNDEDRDSRSIRFSIKDKPNVLLLCLASVRVWLVSAQGEDEFLSNNKVYMTAEIFDALLIRDGQLCHFVEQKLPDITPPMSSDSDDELDWE